MSEESAKVVPAPAPGGHRMSIGDRLDRLPVLPAHHRLTGVIGVGLLFDMYENNLSGVLSKVLQADFALTGTTLKLVLASAFLGQFLGAVVLGRFADRFGRRRAFLVNLALYSGASLAGAFAPSVAWLVALRFVAGIGIGAEQSLTDTYLTDVLPARHRGRLIAWTYTIGFCGVPAVGLLAVWLVPLSPLGIAGWRWLFLFGALGSAVVWVLRRGLFESPRWLATVGRTAEAEAITAKLEAQAGPSYATTALPAPVVEQAPAPERGMLRSLFSAPYRRRTVMMWVFCLLSTVGYYGFGTLAPQVLAAKGYDVVAGLGYTAVSFFGYPVGSLLAAPLMDRIERKVLVAGSACAMAAAGLGFAFAGSVGWVVAFGFGYTLLSNVFSAASHVLLAEQYPTAIRAGASGIAYSLSKLTAAALPFLLLPLLDSGGAGLLFTVIAGAMAVLALDVVVLGDRTTGRPVDRLPAR
ncbi:MFS transporter [Streptomyces viridochromogenes]|uniref:MFS transporter n=1 Tax=Streptomyces viridochromogenes TaxID=1938 RepID=A0A0J8C3I3_STRVR|nr:MFS transporter [Streptomyces viridochromogenes]KMS72365.1 MFS transporter [Streptomyces viridochromogenes]KOG16324.1 MFS transporter [Streptomyces viridochromogenes]KOG16860.1 MFS transporter [Streptomyces viridochromogenes]